MSRKPLGLVLALLALAMPDLAGAAPSPFIFQAPSGRAPAGATSLGDPFARVLPSGRLLRPAGTSVVIGTNARGVTLTPGGHYAVVSSGSELGSSVASTLDPSVTAAYTLTVFDTATMRAISRFTDPSVSFYGGVVALTDPLDPTNTLVFASGGKANAVYVFDVDSTGTIRRDTQQVAVAIPGLTDARYANAGRSFPVSLVASASGTRVFAVDALGNDVAQIDTATRTLAGPSVPVGYFPFAAALGTNGLLVANQGLLSYQTAAAPAAAPAFETVPSDLARASSLSVVEQSPDGTLAGAVDAYAPLDRTPDGLQNIGGAQPAAVAGMKRRPYAFVAMSSVDRIATISLAGGTPRVAGGTELRLFNRGPYGTQPDALVLAPSERRLYVALAGIDAIAVLDTSDPQHLHRLGLIPTGWYPSALALSPDGRYLYVCNTKGIGNDRGFTGDQASTFDTKGRVTQVREDASLVWSTLERIDLTKVDLRKVTPVALSYLRTITTLVPSALVPQRFGSNGSARIKHVVCIVPEGETYDSIFGDLTDAAGAHDGPGDANYVAFDASVTPNLHALARTYAVAGNLYADATDAATGSQYAAGGIATNFAEKFGSVLGAAEDPEDYPRSGYIFNSLAGRAKTYRDYGALLRLSGLDNGNPADPKTDDAATGLGGLYTLTVPAPLALSGHADLNFPAWNPRIRNTRRAAEFVRDFDQYVKSDTLPAFTYVALPPAHKAPGALGPASLSDDVADTDSAIGTIVDYISHTPQWSSTAIFVLPSDSLGTRDHVAVSRSYALVISPYAKRRYIGMRHLSTASVLKTEEEILGLPALSLGDALASDMNDFFTLSANPAPYEKIDASASAPGPTPTSTPTPTPTPTP